MNQPLKQSQLGLKESKRPDGDNAGFEVESGKASPVYKKDDWQGTVKGKTKNTYKGE